LGSAYKSGFKEAFSRGAKQILTMDADLSHDPIEIPRMLAKLKKFDVIVGSRHIKGGKIIGFGPWRNFLSASAQWLCRGFLGISVKDSTSAFRAYKVAPLKAIEPYTIKSQGYSFLIEVIYRCQKRGFKISENPITYEARKRGKSKISQVEILKALATVARLKFA
jgi:dolichol-phosphate mannosyltransferase